jgi:hypothetical protein
MVSMKRCTTCAMQICVKVVIIPETSDHNIGPGCTTNYIGTLNT